MQQVLYQLLFWNQPFSEIILATGLLEGNWQEQMDWMVCGVLWGVFEDLNLLEKAIPALLVRPFVRQTKIKTHF